MDKAEIVSQLKSIVKPRLDYWENLRPGIFKDKQEDEEFKIMFAMLISSTFYNPNQKKIIHDYIDGICLIEVGDYEKAKSLMMEGKQLIDDFTGSELFHLNVINAFIDPNQTFTVGKHKFDTKESLKKYLQENKVRITSEEVIGDSLSKLVKEKEEFLRPFIEREIKKKNPLTAAQAGFMLFFFMIIRYFASRVE